MSASLAQINTVGNGTMGHLSTLQSGYAGANASNHGKSGLQLYKHFFRSPHHRGHMGGGHSAQINPSIFFPFSQNFRNKMHGMPPVVQKSIQNFGRSY